MANSRNGRQPGIADVARLAGVSITTVSRVLNGSEQVSDRRRARILQAIEDLDYRPNEAARALVSGRQRMIGVLTGNTSRYGYGTTVEGIEEAARRRNMLVTITVVESEDPDHIRSAVDLVLSQPLSGVIGIEFDRDVSLALQRLPKTMPAVSASLSVTNLSGLPRAYIDDERGAELATEYLLDLGHETVHHLAVGFPNSNEHGRTQGYIRTLERRGARVPDVISTGWHPLEARRAAFDGLGDDVTAVFCFNDEVAMGTMRALHERGRRVPEDVSVVGFDDAPLSSVWTPALSSVRIDFQGLGRATFRLLRSIIDADPAVANVELPPVLVPRESAGPPRLS